MKFGFVLKCLWIARAMSVHDRGSHWTNWFVWTSMEISPLDGDSRTKADRFCGKVVDVPNDVVTSLLMILCGRDSGP